MPCTKNVVSTCVEERQETFEQGFDFVCFDNFWLSMITLFQICTLEGWSPIMYALTDCDGPIQIFFISFLLICSFLMLNLVVGVICDAYANVLAEAEGEGEIEHQSAEEADQSYSDMRSKAHAKEAEAGTGATFCLRVGCQALVRSSAFEMFIMALILINTVMWAGVYHGIDDKLVEWLDLADICFTMVYVVEILIKIIDLGNPCKYLDYSSNVFDCCITLASLFFFVLSVVTTTNVDVTMLRALRLTRALRVLNMSKGLREIVQTVSSSLSGTVNVMFCTIFFMVVYAVMGVQLFHKTAEAFGR